MLNKELEQSLNKAFHDANEKRHEFITVEHLLLMLTENDAATAVIEACGADVRIGARVERRFDVGQRHQRRRHAVLFQRVGDRVGPVAGADQSVAEFVGLTALETQLARLFDPCRLFSLEPFIHGKYSR